jgi:hypothetical protein
LSFTGVLFCVFAAARRLGENTKAQPGQDAIQKIIRGD